MMRLSITILTATLLTGSLVDCSNGYGVPQAPSISANGSASKTSVAPVELRSSAILAKIHAADRRDQADAVTPGIYAMVATSLIYAYPDPDSSNGPPVCSVGPVKDLRSLAVDRKGDLLVGTVSYSPELSTVTIFKGPGLCGPELGSIADPYGFPPATMASRDAQRGTIVVGNSHPDRGNPKRGGVTVCTLSGGCTVRLNAPTLDNIYSVAIAPNGDCWAAGSSKSIRTTLAYFAQCRHRGVIATGFKGGLDDWLDIDGKGNLVTISSQTASTSLNGLLLFIYSGCNPACTLVGGPFQVKGCCGHLDASSKHLVVVDTQSTQSNQLDVYSYSTSGVKYEYSISNGLTSAVYGAAYSPSSKE